MNTKRVCASICVCTLSLTAVLAFIQGNIGEGINLIIGAFWAFEAVLAWR